MDENKKIKGNMNLTEGPIAKKLLLFALPIILGNMVQQLYNVVDTVVVGNFVSSDALAAVSVSFPVMMIFNSLFMGLSMGSNIIIAQYRGAGDREKLERALNNTASITIVMGALITVLGLMFSRGILELLNTPANIIDDSTAYLKIVFGGTLGNMMYNTCNGIARGMGDSKTPLKILILSSCINIVLDLLFVIKFNMGVAGVAWATLIAHIFSGLIMLLRIIRGKYGARVTLKGMLHMDWNMVGLVVKLGLPSAIQNVAMSIGSTIMQTYSNRFGSDYLAAHAVVQKADGFAMMPMMGLGMAVTTFVGQNIGAGDTERAKKGTNSAAFICTGIGAIVAVILYFFGIYIMRAFTSNPDVLYMGERGLKFLAFFYIFIGINNCMGGACRGAGATVVPAAMSMVGTFVRIPLAYFLAIKPLNEFVAAAVAAGQYVSTEAAVAAGAGITENYMGLFYTQGISMVIGAAMMFVYYKWGNWHTKGVTAKMNGPKPAAKEA